MGIKILHLSDIHFNYSGYDTSRMKEKLIPYIKQIASTVDFVAVSGDIAYQYGEYTTATRFCNDIKDVLGTAEIVVVPGNHDLDRNNTSRSLIIKGLNSETSRVDMIADGGTKSTLLRAFDNYIRFQSDVSSVSRVQTADLIELSKCNVLLINSALTSYCKDDDGHLDVDIVFIESLLKSKNDIKPTIALGHHALDCLNSGSRQKLCNLFRDYNIYLYLCGHSHIMQISDYLTSLWATKQLVSGSMIVDKYSDNGFYIIDYCEKYFTASAHWYNIDSECWEPYEQYPNSDAGLIKCVFTTGTNAGASGTTTVKDMWNILKLLDDEIKSLIVLVSKYPELARFDLLSEQQFELLTTKQLIEDATNGDLSDSNFSLSAIGVGVVNLLTNDDKRSLIISVLDKLAGTDNNERTSYYLFKELYEVDRLKATSVMEINGRVWLETEGIDICTNEIVKLPNHTDNLKLVYLQGLGELFRGQYKIAKNTFLNGLSIINEADNDIKCCFKLESIECDRRNNEFEAVVNALNELKDIDLGTSHWSGVSYELLAHFARQFNLVKESIEYYDKAIAIFDKGSAKPDAIEKWHCLYARNMLDYPQPMQFPPSGHFLHGLYALSNAKYYAINGNRDIALRYTNDASAHFDMFNSGIYKVRATILKLLIHLAAETTASISEAFSKLSNEELAIIRHDAELSTLLQNIHHNNLTKLDKFEQCSLLFAKGKSSKGLAFLALIKKYIGLQDGDCYFKSLRIRLENSSYEISEELIDYSSHLEHFNIPALIINYV